MDTRELQALIAVADEKSFHGAAARLGLTQPAITRRIQRLEERIGAQLFDRSLKPLQPTPAGHWPKPAIFYAALMVSPKASPATMP